MSSLREDLDNAENHMRAFFTGHKAEIERGIKLAEKADADPAVGVLLAAIGIPPGARAALGEFLAKLDAEFTAAVSGAHEAGRKAAQDPPAPLPSRPVTGHPKG